MDKAASAGHSDRNCIDHITGWKVRHCIESGNAQNSTTYSHDDRNPFVWNFLICLAAKSNYITDCYNPYYCS